MTHHNALRVLSDLPEVAVVSDAFNTAGAELAIVGGSVRDALLHGTRFDARNADLDFATPLGPDDVLRIVEPLGPVWTAGARFGTIGVSIDAGFGPMQVEITQFRSEHYDEGSRKPTVTAAETLEADLSRRDLTINAMALRNNGDDWELVDPFDGSADLAAGVLRCPGDPDTALAEDPLRVIRLVRFAVRLGFRVEDRTAAAARRQSHRLGIVAAERITAELRKILTHGTRAFANAIGIAAELGCAEQLTGGTKDTARLAATLEALEQCDLDPATVSVAQLALHNGDTSALRRLKLSNDEIRPAADVLRCVPQLRSCATPAQARRLLRTHGTGTVELSLTVADAAGVDVRTARDVIRTVLRADRDFANRPLPVDGHDALAAGLTGRQVGDALRRVEDALCERGHLDRPTALELLRAG